MLIAVVICMTACLAVILFAMQIILGLAEESFFLFVLVLFFFGILHPCKTFPSPLYFAWRATVQHLSCLRPQIDAGWQTQPHRYSISSEDYIFAVRTLIFGHFVRPVAYPG